MTLLLGGGYMLWCVLHVFMQPVTFMALTDNLLLQHGSDMY
jgi:hypothetical protein